MRVMRVWLLIYLTLLVVCSPMMVAAETNETDFKLRLHRQGKGKRVVWALEMSGKVSANQWVPVAKRPWMDDLRVRQVACREVGKNPSNSKGLFMALSRFSDTSYSEYSDGGIEAAIIGVACKGDEKRLADCHKIFKGEFEFYFSDSYSEPVSPGVFTCVDKSAAAKSVHLSKRDEVIMTLAGKNYFLTKEKRTLDVACRHLYPNDPFIFGIPSFDARASIPDKAALLDLDCTGLEKDLFQCRRVNVENANAPTPHTVSITEYSIIYNTAELDYSPDVERAPLTARCFSSRNVKVALRDASNWHRPSSRAYGGLVQITFYGTKEPFAIAADDWDEEPQQKKLAVILCKQLFPERQFVEPFVQRMSRTLAKIRRSSVISMPTCKGTEQSIEACRWGSTRGNDKKLLWLSCAQEQSPIARLSAHGLLEVRIGQDYIPAILPQTDDEVETETQRARIAQLACNAIFPDIPDVVARVNSSDFLPVFGQAASIDCERIHTSVIPTALEDCDLQRITLEDSFHGRQLYKYDLGGYQYSSTKEFAFYEAKQAFVMSCESPGSSPEEGSTSVVRISPHGWIELALNGRAWIPVSSNGFGEREATVFCRTLGHHKYGYPIRPSTLEAMLGAQFVYADPDDDNSYDSLHVAYSDYPSRLHVGSSKCTGLEETFFDCVLKLVKEVNGRHRVGVRCTDEMPPPFEQRVRIAPGSTNRLQVLVDGVWGTVCRDEFTPAMADLVCTSLGYSYGDSVSGAELDGPSPSPQVPIHLGPLKCPSDFINFFECSQRRERKGQCQTHDTDVGVNCYNGPNTFLSILPDDSLVIRSLSGEPMHIILPVLNWNETFSTLICQGIDPTYVWGGAKAVSRRVRRENIVDIECPPGVTSLEDCLCSLHFFGSSGVQPCKELSPSDANTYYTDVHLYEEVVGLVCHHTATPSLAERVRILPDGLLQVRHADTWIPVLSHTVDEARARTICNILFPGTSPVFLESQSISTGLEAFEFLDCDSGGDIFACFRITLLSKLDHFRSMTCIGEKPVQVELSKTGHVVVKYGEAVRTSLSTELHTHEDATVLCRTWNNDNEWIGHIIYGNDDPSNRPRKERQPHLQCTGLESTISGCPGFDFILHRVKILDPSSQVGTLHIRCDLEPSTSPIRWNSTTGIVHTRRDGLWLPIGASILEPKLSGRFAWNTCKDLGFATGELRPAAKVLVPTQSLVIERCPGIERFSPLACTLHKANAPTLMRIRCSNTAYEPNYRLSEKYNILEVHNPESETWHPTCFQQDPLNRFAQVVERAQNACSKSHPQARGEVAAAIVQWSTGFLDEEALWKFPMKINSLIEPKFSLSMEPCDYLITIDCGLGEEERVSLDPDGWTLRFRHDDAWVGICDDDGFDDTAASVACRQLGHTLGFVLPNQPTSSSIRFTPFVRAKWKIEECAPNAKTLQECRGKSTDDFCQPVRVLCFSSQDIHTDMLQEAMSKQLHVVVDGTTTAICADKKTFGQTEVDVACREMEFDTGGLLPLDAHPFPNLNIASRAVSHVSCNGTENKIEECTFQIVKDQCPFHYIGVSCYSTRNDRGAARLGPDGKRFEIRQGNRWSGLQWKYVTDHTATVACRMLGKARGEVLGIESDPAYKILTLNWNFACNGSEATLLDCNKYDSPCYPSHQCMAARVQCYDDPVPNPFIRLSPLSDNAEVFHNGLWGQVCGSLTDATATVACRQLGYTSGTLLEAKVSDSVPDSIRDPQCNGDEDSLFQCPSYRGSGTNKLCRPGTPALRVACSGRLETQPLIKGHVKLDTDGFRLLVFRNGTWGTVGTGSGFDTNAATVACKQMGFGLGKVVFQWPNQPEWDPTKARISSVKCKGDETSLFNCVFEDENFGELDTAVGLECIPKSYVQDVAFRLDKRGYVTAKGRDQDEFLPVVSLEPTDREANVACRSLGFSSGTLLSSPQELVKDNVVFLDPCSLGTESNLLQCHLRFVPHDYPWNDIYSNGYSLIPAYLSTFTGGYSQSGMTTSRALRVSCKDDLGPKVRLIRSKKDKHTGRLEIQTPSGFKAVCPDGVTTTEATVACRQLQLGLEGVVVAPQLAFVDIDRIDELRCTGSELSLDQCHFTDRSDCAGARPLEIRCERSSTHIAHLRLSSQGRLEISLGNEWGSVCRSGFGEEEARLSCRTLGYQSGVLAAPKRTSNSLRMMVDQVTCTGLEESVLDCAYSTQVRRGCKQLGWKKEVFLTCYEDEDVPPPAHVARTRSIADEEIVEIYDTENRQWRTVCSHITPHTAQILCQTMGFDTGATAQEGRIPSTSTAQTKLFCPNDVDNLSNCSRTDVDECDGDAAATVVCKNLDTPGTSSSMLPARLFESTLQVLILGTDTYGTVCSQNKPFGGHEAVVACRMLGLVTGYPVTVTNDQSLRATPTPIVAMQDVSCRGNELSLRQCTFADKISKQCKRTLPAQGVQCYPSLSAVHLNSKQAAFLDLGGKQFRIKQTEPFVPDDALRIAKVLCRMGGFSDFLDVRFLRVKKGRGVGQLESVYCTGEEDSVLNCIHSVKESADDNENFLSVECTAHTSLTSCHTVQTVPVWQNDADVTCPSPTEFQSMTLSCACEYFAGGRCQRIRSNDQCESISSAGMCSWFDQGSSSFCGVSFERASCLHRYNQDTLADLIRDEVSLRVGADTVSLPVLPSETDSSQCPTQCDYEKRQRLCLCHDYYPNGNCKRRHKMKNCPTDLGCSWVGDGREGLCVLRPNDAAVRDCPWYHSQAVKKSLTAGLPDECESLGPSSFWFQFGRSRVRAGACLPAIH